MRRSVCGFNFRDRPTRWPTRSSASSTYCAFIAVRFRVTRNGPSERIPTLRLRERDPRLHLQPQLRRDRHRPVAGIRLRGANMDRVLGQINVTVQKRRRLRETQAGHPQQRDDDPLARVHLRRQQRIVLVSLQPVELGGRLDRRRLQRQRRVAQPVALPRRSGSRSAPGSGRSSRSPASPPAASSATGSRPLRSRNSCSHTVKKPNSSSCGVISASVPLVRPRHEPAQLRLPALDRRRRARRRRFR